MNLPKIKFRKMTLKENVDLVKWAYFENGDSLDIHNYTIQYFKELYDINKEGSEEEIYEIIERIVESEYKKYDNKISSEIERYDKLWDSYNDEYFSKLSQYLEIEWPSAVEIIEGTVGLIPVFPRYLDKFSFSVSTGLKDCELIEVCAHETLHFLWFEKWKQLYPEVPRREYDSPYVSWKYSEMVTDPILNHKPFSDMFDFNERGYDSFYEIYDNEILAMDNLRKIFGEEISVNEKIDKGFSYIRNILEEKKKTK